MSSTSASVSARTPPNDTLTVSGITGSVVVSWMSSSTPNPSISRLRSRRRAARARSLRSASTATAAAPAMPSTPGRFSVPARRPDS
jgi:hypothetical protein